MKFRLVRDKLKESVKKINHNESKATMKDGTEFNIWTEYDSAGSEQTDCTKIAYIGDNWLDERDRVIRENLLGYLSYSYLRNEKPKTAYVQMIQVKDSMRRKGIATALIESLKQDFGNNIEYGYTTDDGTKLLKGIGIRESVEEEYDSDGNKLTQEQAQFFRNSKIRDSKGRLLVCYHGSKENINTFDKQYISSWNLYGKGFYFTTDINRAKRYAKKSLLTTYINIVNPFTETEENVNKLIKEANIDTEELNAFIENENLIGGKFFGICYYLDDMGVDVSVYLKNLRYDGIITSRDIVAFEPNQIKAITNKNPSSSNNINEDVETKRNKDDVFDVHKSEISYYQDYLDNKEYANKKHNTTSEIVKMSPNEYFKELEKIFPGTTSELQKRGMKGKEEQKIIDGMKHTILNTNRKLPIPFLNYTDIPGQEGRHRMVAAGDIYGWDEKFPVLIIKWTKEQEEEYKKEKINSLIEKAIDKTLQYTYKDYDKFREELDYQVDYVFADNEEKIKEYNVRETNSTFIVRVNGLECMIEKDDIKMREDDGQELDDDFDWLDDEEIDKLLKEIRA